MNMLDLYALLLLALPVFDWIAAGILWNYSRTEPQIVALRERRNAAIVLTIAASMVALLAFSHFDGDALPSDLTVLLLSLALVLISVPQVWWLALLASGRFGTRD